MNLQKSATALVFSCIAALATANNATADERSGLKASNIDELPARNGRLVG